MRRMAFTGSPRVYRDGKRDVYVPLSVERWKQLDKLCVEWELSGRGYAIARIIEEYLDSIARRRIVRETATLRERGY